MHGRTAQTGQQKQDSDHQQTVYLALAELGIGGHFRQWNLSGSRL